MTVSQGKGTILVTGASSGIGKATVVHLDNLGYIVFGTVRQEQDAEMLRAETSDRTHPLIMDVTDGDSIAQAKGDVQKVMGDTELLGLVNNAGIAINGALEFYPLDEVRKMYEVNLFGVLAVTQAFLPMLRQARGRIVNISSTSTLIVLPTHGPYSSAKCALNGRSQALRLELLPHGVHVSIVICGSMDTAVWDKFGKLRAEIADQYPPETEELYGSILSQMELMFAHAAKTAAPPEIAAQVIV